MIFILEGHFPPPPFAPRRKRQGGSSLPVTAPLIIIVKYPFYPLFYPYSADIDNKTRNCLSTPAKACPIILPWSRKSTAEFDEESKECPTTQQEVSSKKKRKAEKVQEIKLWQMATKPCRFSSQNGLPRIKLMEFLNI